MIAAMRKMQLKLSRSRWLC